jgi:hypothetical protein
MNWGHRILILYLSFVVMISFLIYLCSAQKFDLVSENYYDKEIKFQEQIDRMNNAIADSSNVLITNNEVDNSINISFRKINNPDDVNGVINFFRPDNSAVDFAEPIKLNPENMQIISTSKMTKGKWLAKFQWNVKGRSYYQEEAIYIK